MLVHEAERWRVLSDEVHCVYDELAADLGVVSVAASVVDGLGDFVCCN